jgi:adenylate cyclase
MARLFKAVSLGLLIGMLGLVASLSPFGLDLEESVGLEFFFKWRGVRKAPDEVMIVSIDNSSAAHLNLAYDPAKWPRAHHARLVENLANAGAAVIVFDIIFQESRSPEHDSLLAVAIRNAGNVVLFEYLKRETLSLTNKAGFPTNDLYIQTRVPPIPLLAQPALALAPFPLPKVPVKVSQYWTFKTGAGSAPTLPAVAFQIFSFEVYDSTLAIQESTLCRPGKSGQAPSRNSVKSGGEVDITK